MTNTDKQAAPTERAAQAVPAGPLNLRELAERAGIRMDCWDMGAASLAYSEGCHGITKAHLEKFAGLVGFECWNRALESSPKAMRELVESALYPAAPAPEAHAAPIKTYPPSVLQAMAQELAPQAQAAGQELPPHPLPSCTDPDEFIRFLNDRRGFSVSEVFHEICAQYRAAVSAANSLAQRQPLTDGAIRAGCDALKPTFNYRQLAHFWFANGVAFAENAHGIGAATGEQQHG